MEFSGFDEGNMGTSVSDLMDNNDQVSPQQNPELQQQSTSQGHNHPQLTREQADELFREQNKSREMEILQSSSHPKPQQKQQNILSSQQTSKPVEQTLIEDSYDKYLQTKETIQLKEKPSILSNIPKYFKEILLLMMLYYLLSIPQIQYIFTTYLPQLTPSETGAVPFGGIFIYGLILSTSFFTLRNYLL